MDVSKWGRFDDEWIGDQEKEWLVQPTSSSEVTGGKWLFKPSRRTEFPGRAGAPSRIFTWFEAHSEWIARQLASSLRVPSADIRLAQRQGVLGSLSRDVTTSNEDLQSGDVFLSGLPEHVYIPNGERARNRVGHHLDAIGRVLDGIDGPTESGGRDALETFAGYLVLDAWIGNTDRHAENWALTVKGNTRRLAASFDHGSALAAGRPGSFLARREPGEFADGAMARKFDRGHNVTLVELALEATSRWGGSWLEALELIEAEDERSVVDAVPGLSDLRRTFICRLLEENRRRLLRP